MEDDRRNTDLFRQDLKDESSSTNLQNENPQGAAAETSKDGADILPQITEIIVNELGAASANANASDKSGKDERATMDISSTTKTEVKAGTVASKKVQKRPRAKPGFGLRTSRTTIVETGQKRRSCICANSKLCNELMTRWAKVSPPDYHCKFHGPTLLFSPILYWQWDTFSNSRYIIVESIGRRTTPEGTQSNAIFRSSLRRISNS